MKSCINRKERFYELENACQWMKLVSRKSPPLWRDLETKGYTRNSLIKYTGVDAFISWKADEYVLYCNASELAKASSEFRSLAEINFNIFDDIARRCYALCESYLTFCIAQRNTIFQDCTDAELQKLFTEYIEKNVAIVAFRPSVLMLDNIVTAMIGEEVAKFPDADFRYELIIPTKDLPFMAQQRDILDIGSALEDANINNTDCLPSEIEGMITAHIEKYGWLYTHRYLGEPITREDVISTLNQCLGSCRSRVEDIMADRYSKEAALSKIKLLSDRLTQLIGISQEYAFLRTYRMDAAIEGDFYLRPFFNEIARRIKMEYEDLIYLTSNEIVRLLSNEMGVEDMHRIIKKRRDYFVFYLVDDSTVVSFEGKEYETFPIHDTAIPQSAIIGKVAQRGRIIGSVKVVRSKEEIGKVNEGDIIVSPMTTPEMIGGLLKCAGIVTDEGGISSHAAQISREFNIPCIIGTINASNILKDGDVVEIVAEDLEGTVILI